MEQENESSLRVLTCATPSANALGLSSADSRPELVSVSVVVDRAFVGGSTLSFWYRPDLVLQVCMPAVFYISIIPSYPSLILFSFIYIHTDHLAVQWSSHGWHSHQHQALHGLLESQWT